MRLAYGRQGAGTRAPRPLARPPKDFAISQRIDADLLALRTTFDSLLGGGGPHLPAGGPAVEAVDQAALHVKACLERLLRREPGASRLELEELLIDSCTWGYRLEAQRLRTKRSMVAALADASLGPAAEEAREEVLELASRYCSIAEELERVAVVIARLRARLQEVDPA